MVTEIDKQTVAKAYAGWAPVYDLVFGPVFTTARNASIGAAERIGGRILDVGSVPASRSPPIRPTIASLASTIVGRCCARRNSASLCMT